MTKVWRWAKRIVTTMVIVGVVTITTILIAIHTDWGRDKIRAQVQAILSDEFSGGARIGKVEGSPFSELVVKDIVINGTDKTPLVTVGTVTVRLDILPLFARRVVITKLAIDDVAVDLHPRPPEPPKPDEPPPGVDVELRHVTITKARVAIVGMTPEDIHVDDLGIAAVAKLPGDGGGATVTALVGARWRERGGMPIGILTHDVYIGETIEIPFVKIDAGGASVIASSVIPDPDAPIGHVIAWAPPSAVTSFVPELELPAVPFQMAFLEADVHGNARRVEVALVASAGEAKLEGWLDLGLDKLDGKFVGIARISDLAPLTQHVLRGPGAVGFAVEGDPDGVRGLVLATEQFVGVPPASLLASIDATRARVLAAVIAAGPGDAQATVLAELAISPALDRVTVTSAKIEARVADLPAASLGLVEIGGTASLSATIAPGGTLVPALDLAITGTASARGTQVDDLVIAATDARFKVKLVDLLPIGSIHAEARGVTKAGMPLGTVIVDASNRDLETFDVSVHAIHPFAIGDIDAVLRLPRPGTPLTIDLGRHEILMREAKRELAGDGGRITVDAGKITLANLVTSHRGGRATIDATVHQETQDLTAKVVATNLALALVEPTAKGSGSATIAVTRTRGVWGGKITATATGVELPGRPVKIEGDVSLSLVGRRVSLIANTRLDPAVQQQGLLAGLHGAAEVALEIDGPRDVTDPRAWKQLTRKDLRAGSIALHSLDLGMVGASGMLDGTILLSPSDTHGTIDIKHVVTPLGPVNGTMTLDNSGGEISAKAEAKIEGVGLAQIDGRVAIPDHLFDPTAWIAMGRGAVREINVRVDDVAIGPELLAKLDIHGVPFRGRATLALHVGEGIESAWVTVDGRQLGGGPIVKPLTLAVRAELTPQNTTATVDISSATNKLLHLDATLPVTFEGWLDDGPAQITTAPLAGTLTIPSTKAAVLLAIFGRSDVLDGTVDGTGELHGTVLMPTGSFSIVGRDIKVPPHVSGRPIPVLSKLEVGGTWTGVDGSVSIVGLESDGGRLKIQARARPDRLAEGVGGIDISRFDLAPLAAFLPGAFVSTSGRLDGTLEVTGFTPESAKVRGKLTLSEGRLPISPYVGTLRDSRIDLEVTGRTGKLTMSGSLGGTYGNNRPRTVSIVATGDTRTIDAVMTLDHVQPITALQPIITARVTAKLERGEDRLRAQITVDRGVVQIPKQSGAELHAQKAPLDMKFVDDPAAASVKVGSRPPPMTPWLIAEVTIKSTQIDADELRGSVRGDLSLSIGDGPQGTAVGMIGLVQTEQGLADVFGHRYYVDRGNVTFDGSTDAQLDIKLIHEFPQLTLIAEVGGRISNPQITMSSNPPQYSEGQLLGFFLGGTPGGDPNSQTREAATGATTSLLSRKIQGVANRVSPVKIDVFNCSLSTSTSSTACTVGKWITQKLFLAFRPHLEARPDENTYEGRVEYYLRQDLVIEGNAGDRQHHGLDLLWRHRW